MNHTFNPSTQEARQADLWRWDQSALHIQFQVSHSYTCGPKQDFLAHCEIGEELSFFKAWAPHGSGGHWTHSVAEAGWARCFCLRVLGLRRVPLHSASEVSCITCVVKFFVHLNSVPLFLLHLLHFRFTGSHMCSIRLSLESLRNCVMNPFCVWSPVVPLVSLDWTIQTRTVTLVVIFLLRSSSLDWSYFPYDLLLVGYPHRAKKFLFGEV